MITAAAYIRVSTEDQVEFSPDSQIKKIREYAYNCKIVLPEELIFIDEGISGKYAQKRPAFMKMIGEAKTKPTPFQMILVWKFSRFARSRQDSIIYKSMLRKECGIEVVSITEQISKDPTAILIEALLEAMDEYYSINLAQEVKRGMNEKFSRGGVVSKPPLGYVMGTERFEIDHAAAGYIQMIYQDFLGGMAYRQIAQKLNDMGVRSARGKLFENRTIEYILRNHTYLGKMRRNLKGLDRKDRYRQSTEVSIVDAEHDPIIDKPVFQAVQKRIEKIKKVRHIQNHAAYADFMLKGLVRCSNCGSTLTQTAKGKALQCHKYARGQCKKSHGISLDKLNKAVMAKISEDLGEIELKIMISQPEKTATGEVAAMMLFKEYKRLERVKAAYDSGIDSIEEYKVNKMKIINRIGEIEKQLKKQEIAEEQIPKTFKIALKEVVAKLPSAEINENDKNKMLRAFIAKIIFKRSDGTIELYYYF